jgi:hypothetical protein
MGLQRHGARLEAGGQALSKLLDDGDGLGDPILGANACAQLRYCPDARDARRWQAEGSGPCFRRWRIASAQAAGSRSDVSTSRS